MAPQKPKGPRKTVSFLAHPPASEEEHVIDVLPKEKSPFLIPAHLPLVLYGMVQDGLTDTVLPTMARWLLRLAVLQMAYGVLLARVTKTGSVALVLIATAEALLLSPVMFIVMVLMGAPLYGFRTETFVLACHVSLIMVQPVLVAAGLDHERLKHLLMLERIYKLIFSSQVLTGTLFTALGAWMGVIPIPLDWDRPWQQWPITILAGAYVGAFVGPVLGLFL